MNRRMLFSACCLVLTAITQPAFAQSEGLRPPKVVEAGSAFSIPTAGNGKAILYIVSPAQVLQRTVQLGDNVIFASGEVHNAGHYLALLAGDSFTQTAEFDVVAARQPKSLSFLAKPSRLPVGLPNGISGVVYIFDIFHNLLLEPTQVLFQLSESAASPETRTATTRNGVAWLKMNSAAKAGSAQFQATAGNVTDKRVLQQVPGDPCNLRMSAQLSGKKVVLETTPIKDCSGNPIPDGTVVTFTETYDKGSQATVDVPVKRGVARAEMPDNNGAVISVATGIVTGNEIRLGNAR